MTAAADRWAELSPGVAQDQRPVVSLEALRTAARGLEGVAVKTPLLDLPTLAAKLGFPVGVKCEHLQPIGAFKIRGAFTAMSRIPPEDRARGVITSSSGN